jgi:hypothetical protein
MITTRTRHTVSQAARLFPTVNGKTVDPSTVWRWVNKGVRGIKLQCERVGGRIVITDEAIHEFQRATQPQGAAATADLSLRAAAAKERLKKYGW